MKKNLFTLSFLILALGIMAQTPRLCLFEEFTGETCPPCASTNPLLNQNLLSATNATKIISIKWQVPIPSAPTKTWSLYQTNKTEINWRYQSYGYGVNSAPTGRIDGQNMSAFGAASDHPQNLWASQGGNAVISAAQSHTSAFSITMTRDWNRTCSAVILTVNIQATAAFTSSGPLVFRTVMVERLITFSVQPGTNGEKVFEDAAIKSFPSIQTGIAMASNWTVGQTQTFTLNCPIPAYVRDKEEIALVGFIQDDGNRKVAQACRANKAALPPDALSGISSQVGITCTSMISPTVEIKNENASNAITNLTLTPVIDAVAGTPIPWTGNIAPGASEFIVLSSITSPAMAGSHSFSCDIEMPATPYNMVINGTKVNYIVGGNYQAVPVAEGFVNATFPPAGFGVINMNNGPGWSRLIATGGYNLSMNCSKYNFFNNTVIGDQDELYLPPMDLSTATGAQLSFDVAYAQRTANSDDALDVMISDNCGSTWTTVYNAHGVGLTNTTPVSGFEYVPDPTNPSQWRTELIDLSAYSQNDLLIKYVVTNDNGNSLYLDNINLSFTPTGIKNHASSALKVALYPNPTNGSTQIQMQNMKAGAAKISVVNTLGQQVYVKEVSLTEGTNTVEIDLQGYASGIYNVSIDSNTGSVVKKLTLTK